MKTIITCSNLTEVAMVRSLLEGDSIEVHVPQEHTPQPFAGFPGGFQIQVDDDLERRALEILRSANYSSIPLVGNSNGAGVTSPRLAWFRWLVVTDALLAIGVWLSAQRIDNSMPPAVRDYLDSLAASLELWSLGYYVYLIGFVTYLIGAMLLLFRMRMGLWMFVGGLALETLWAWVFPGGIIYGVANVFSMLELVLAGIIIGWAFSDRILLSPGS